jgi:hypothetical protein
VHLLGCMSPLLAIATFGPKTVVGRFRKRSGHSAARCCVIAGLSELTDETILDKFNGEPIRLPYDFWIMRNVREALQTLAMQS